MTLCHPVRLFCVPKCVFEKNKFCVPFTYLSLHTTLCVVRMCCVFVCRAVQCCRVLQSVVECSRVLQSVAECCRVLPCVVMCCCVL